jgi:hypothetical protein
MDTSARFDDYRLARGPARGGHVISTAPPGPTGNIDVPLYDGRLRVRHPGGVANGRGHIRLAWGPVPRVRFAVEVSGIVADDNPTVEFAMSRKRGGGPTLITRSTSRSSSGGTTTALDGYFTMPISVGQGRSLARVEFAVVNLPRLYLPVATSVGPWQVSILSTASPETFQGLHDEGGYALTATGTVVRSDSRRFSRAAVGRLLESLAHYLSFAAGAWIAVTLLRGEDDHGDTIWREWDIFRSSRAEPRLRWLPGHDPQPAMDLWGAWHTKWLDPYWREVLSRVVYLAIDANRRHVDIGLLTAQAALETLAYAISVVDRRSIAPAAFDARGYTAAQKIRGLLADVGLSAGIPAALSALQAMPNPTPSSDGPWKLTWLRNRLTHPLKSARLPANSVETTEAWMLALWYVEASLLAFLGYRGSVWSRVSGGNVPFP